MSEGPADPCPRDPLFDQPGEVLYADLSDRLFDASGTWSMRGNGEMLWLDPRPRADALHLLYQQYYTHEAAAGSPGGLIGMLYKQSVGRLAYMRERAAMQVMHLGPGEARRVLDVGCGDGALLASLRDMGWQVEGQEVDAQAASRAKEQYDIDVHVGEIEHIDLPEAAFDAVVMNHVVEHLPKPLLVLRRARALLKPSGELIATTPNCRSFGHARFGCEWRGLEVPRHLQVFSTITLQRLAETAGFAGIRVTTSCARAQAFARGSLDIRAGVPGGVTRDLQALLFQWRACFHHHRHPDSGEELILRAIR